MIQVLVGRSNIVDKNDSTSKMIPPMTGREQSAIEAYSDGYEKSIVVRAGMIALFPVIGGIVDMLAVKPINAWRNERVTDFLMKLDSRLYGLEVEFQRMAGLNREALIDWFCFTIDSVGKHRSTEKRERFAQILKTQIENERSWDEVESVSRLVGELSDLHIAILKEVCSAPVCLDPFSGKKISVVFDLEFVEVPRLEVKELRPMFTSVEEAVLGQILTDLISKGLIVDAGVGRWNTRALTYFAPTKFGDWFLNWIES